VERNTTPNLGVFYLAQTTVQSGFAAQLDVELSTSAQAAYDAYLNPGSATANFLNTLAWGGIQSVTVNGQPVNYSLSSTSGTNWNQSFVPATDTPEPASGFLIAAVIAGMWFLRRRRHSDGYSDLDSSRSPANRP
jgi:hypothetical protein